MRWRRWVLPVCLGVIGLAAAAIAAAAGAVSTHDAIQLFTESVLGSGAVVALCAIVLMKISRARLGVQIAVAALAPVVAVAVGIVWATSSMFLMAHDTSVLWVVLIGAGTVGMIAALMLGRRIAAASRVVGLYARSLGEHPSQPALAGADPPGAPGGSGGLGGPGAPGASGGGGVPGGLGPSSVVGVPEELAAVVDELRATSARLAEARAQAAATERARRELIAWVSHDLRTPLSGIRLMVEALEDELVDDPATVARYHATIRTETDRLAALVDDLFELSRIQSGALRFEVALRSLDELVAGAVRAAEPAARAKGVQLHHVGADETIWVDINEAAINRVIRNLLDNALRHTPAGEGVTIASDVELAAGAGGGSGGVGVGGGGSGGDGERASLAVVSVFDSCGGIPAVDLERVFEAGYRGDAARTPGPTGSGLGLAIARGLVGAHNGHITVDNEGAGCRFRVALPLHLSANPARTVRSSAQ